MHSLKYTPSTIWHDLLTLFTFIFCRLVNNAGVAMEPRRTIARCHQTDEEVWDTTMKVNAKSMFLGCKYAITQMLAQEPHSSGDRGWIINMSSIMGTVAGPATRRSLWIYPIYLQD